jgi:hypothetical protein
MSLSHCYAWQVKVWKNCLLSIYLGSELILIDTRKYDLQDALPIRLLDLRLLSLAPSLFLFSSQQSASVLSSLCIMLFVNPTLVIALLTPFYVVARTRARYPSPVQSPRLRTRTRTIHRVSPLSAPASLARLPLSVSMSLPNPFPPPPYCHLRERVRCRRSRQIHFPTREPLCSGGSWSHTFLHK